MAQHLQDGTGSTHARHHQQSEQYQSAVAYRRVGVDVFQVGLHYGTERSVHHGNGGQYQEEIAPDSGTGRHQVHGDAETSVTS